MMVCRRGKPTGLCPTCNGTHSIPDVPPTPAFVARKLCPECKGESPVKPGCEQNQWSSRICEHGTLSCVVRHAAWRKQMNLPDKVANEVWLTLGDFAVRFPDLGWCAECDERSLIVVAYYLVRIELVFSSQSRRGTTARWRRFEIATRWAEAELVAEPRSIVWGLERRLAQLRQAVLNHQP